jgi:two-component system, cell cycle sensor histidine kinase and response regulator CckA
MTILLAEDAAPVRELVRHELARRGYSVLEAADVRQALAACGGGPIDLLIADLSLEGGGGVALARKIRERHPGVKVIYVSGHSPDVLESAEPGATFVQKPFDLEDLSRLVRQVLG